MSRRFRIILGWLLALLVVVQNAGNCSGLVLCIESDGTNSIETPAEQTACLARQQATRDSFSSRTGARLGAQCGCLDIPLCFTANLVAARINRASGPRAMTIEPRFPLSAIPCVMPNSVSDFGHAGVHSSSPLSRAISAPRSIVLLV